MPKEPNSYFDNQIDEEEYRRRQAARARRRRQRRNQKLLLLGAFVLAGILVIICFVFIIRSLFGGKGSSSASQLSSSVSAPVQAPSGPGYSWPVAKDPAVWNLILVNKDHPMPDGYNPPLAPVSDIGHNFHADAAADLRALVAACNANEGYSLQINSAYRGPQTQADKRQRVIDALVAQGSSQAEAERTADEIEPRYPLSDHQTALGVNFVTNTVNDTAQAFADTPEYTWLVANAAEYGFVLRFPEGKEAVTGIRYQPYHWRYVGKEDAATMAEFGICLEEYLNAMPSAEEDAGDPSAVAPSGSQTPSLPASSREEDA